jgi:two-component system, chemotaxis family, CheB/CheR fusion protein
MTTTGSSADLEALLDYLKDTRGFDLTAYKRSSLTRRILKRMQMVSTPSFNDYVDYLEVHPEEFALLFNTILINVTSFFRDSSTWEYLGQEIAPRILLNTVPDGLIQGRQESSASTGASGSASPS